MSDFKFPKVPKEKWGVHETHCCILHGCKYGNHDNCPVCQGLIKQEYLCEDCDENWHLNEEEKKSLWLKIDKIFKRTQRELKLKRINAKSK